MQIEVVGNNRVKCTLTSEYLKSRWIDIDDLAYGTEAASNLFRDIMEEAKARFGIDFRSGENRPIMIEAVPMGEGTLAVFISKVDDADELDTRFSRFFRGSASSDADIDDPDLDDIFDEDDEEEPVSREKPRRSAPKPVPVKNVSEIGKPFFELLEKEKEHIKESGCLVTVSFDRLSDIIDLAVSSLKYDGENSVYKNVRGDKFLLVIPAEGENFAKAMSFAEAATEFGHTRIVPKAGAAFLDKSYEVLIASDALRKLSM